MFNVGDIVIGKKGTTWAGIKAEISFIHSTDNKHIDIIFNDENYCVNSQEFELKGDDGNDTRYYI